MSFSTFLAKRNNFFNPETSQVSLKEYAALSADVYYEKNDINRPSLPPGWTRFMESPKYRNDYFGVIYIKNEKNPTDIVAAHRGTKPRYDYIVNDLQAAREKLPSQYFSAYDFLGLAVASLQTKYTEAQLNKVNFSCTGHSIGGALAELTAEAHLPAITFENPGVKNILVALLRSELKNSNYPANEIEPYIKRVLMIMKEQCKNYCADLNLVNCCNEQVGKTYRLKDRGFDYQPIFGNEIPTFVPNSRYWANPYFYMTYTYDQHRIQKILEYLNKNGAIEEVTYPTTFAQCYVNYLDVDKRFQYWDGYARLFWQIRPEAKEKYKTFENYYKVFFNEIRKVQAEAKKIKSFQIDSPDSPLPSFGIFAKKNSVIVVGKQDEFEFEMIDDGKPKKKNRLLIKH